MLEIHAIWLVVTHYGYDAVMELVVDFGDHFVSHYVFVIILKAGAVHGVYTVVRHVRKRRAKKTPTAGPSV